jgi:predicted nucleotidyltransferase
MRTLAEASLTEEERRVLDRWLELMRSKLEIESVWLYGSRARGERPRDGSDIDLLVVTRGDRWRDRRTIRRLLDDAVTAEGAHTAFISAQVWDREWLAHRREIDSFFLREVERDKVVLYERR